MTVTLVGVIGQGTQVSAGNITGTYGQTPTAGNLLIAVLFGGQSIAGPWVSAEYTGTTGWQQIVPDQGDQAVVGTNGTNNSWSGVSIWWKQAAGGDAAPVFTTGANAGYGQACILELNDASTIFPLDTSAVYVPVALNVSYIAGADGPFTTGTVSNTGEYVIVASMVGYGTGAHTPPSGYSNLVTTNFGTTYYAAVDILSNPASGTPATGTSVFTSAETWVLQTIVINNPVSITYNSIESARPGIPVPGVFTPGLLINPYVPSQHYMLTSAGGLGVGASSRVSSGKFLGAPITATAAVTRRLAHILAVLAVLIPALTRKVSRALGAVIAVAASAAASVIHNTVEYYLTVTANLAVTPAAARTIGRVLAAQAALKGILWRTVNVNLPYLTFVENPPGAVANSAEGGTAGVTATTGNSGGVSGDAWDSVSLGGTADIAFDNTEVAHGAFSYKFTTVNAVNCYLTWTTTLGEFPQQWFRVYLYLAVLPAADTTFIKVSSSGTYAVGFQVNAANGYLQLQDSSYSYFYTGTHTVPVGQWFRLEGFVLGDPAVGQVAYNLYDSMDSATATETYTSAATLDTVGNPDEFDFGSTFGDKADFLCWMDDIAVSNSGFIGPVTSYALPLIGVGASVAATVIHAGVEYFLTVVSAIAAIPSARRACNRAFTGALAVAVRTSRDARRTFTGTLSTASAVARNAGKPLNLMVALTSSVIRDIRRTLNGVIVSAASSARDYGKTLTSGVSAASGVIRSVSRPVTAAIVITVSLARSTMKLIAAVAAVTAIAALRKFRQLALSAAIAVSSSITRQVSRPLVTLAALQSTLGRLLPRVLISALILYGNLYRILDRNLYTIQAMTSGVVRRCGKPFNSGIAATSRVSRAASKALSGALAAAGMLLRGLSRPVEALMAVTATQFQQKAKFLTLVAVSVFTGGVTRSASRALSVANVVAGTTAQALSRLIAPVVSVSAYAARRIARPVAGALTVTASQLQQKAKNVALSAGIAASAVTTRLAGKFVSTASALTGKVIRGCGRGLSSGAAFASVALRNVERGLSAQLPLMPAIGVIKAKFLTFATVIASSAVTQQALNLHLNAPVTVSGVVYRQCRRVIISTLAVASVITRGIFHTIVMSAPISFLTGFSPLKAQGVILATAIVVTSTVKRGILHNLSALTTMASGTARVINRSIQGNLSVAGQTARGITRVLKATLAVPTGGVVFSVYIIAVSTIMAVAGAMKRGLRVTETTGIAVVIPVTRFLRKYVLVPLTATASSIAGRPFAVVLVTSLTATGTAVAKFLSTSKVIVIKLGLLTIRWVTGQIKQNWRIP